MKLPGYCTTCRRFKQITATSAAIARVPITGVPEGTCDLCAEGATSRKPGARSTRDERVGRTYRVRSASRTENGKVGVCVSVTYWGSRKVRWVRLRFRDGTEKAYAPSHLTRAAGRT